MLAVFDTGPCYTDPVLHGRKSMANLTITIEEDTLKKARMRALEEGTSVNALVRQYLESYSAARRSHEAVAAEILRLSKKARSRRGSRRWSRDDLHDRDL